MKLSGVLLAAAAVTITIQYGVDEKQTLKISGSPNDALCVAMREMVQLHATEIVIPAGSYDARCPEATSGWNTGTITGSGAIVPGERGGR